MSRIAIHFLFLPILWPLVMLIGRTPIAFSQSASPYNTPIPELADNGQITAGSVNGATVSVRELRIPSKAQDSLQKGLARLSVRDLAGSLRFFRRAIQVYPGFYEAYHNMGVAQASLYQDDEAARSFQTAIELSGNNFPLAEFAYGLLLCRQGNVSEAERLVRHGLEQGKNIPEGYVALGMIMLFLNRLDDSEHYAREALSRDSRCANAYMVLAGVHDSRHNYSNEVQDLNRFIELVPNALQLDAIIKTQNEAERLASDLPPKSQPQ